VPYEPGILKAVGKKGGKIVCTETIETTGKATRLRLTADNNQLKYDNSDIVHVKIEAVDESGRIVPTADNLITYKITGPVRLLGLENGNPADQEPYQSGKRKLYNGLGLAIVQAGKTPGKATLIASSEGMKDVSIEITILK
jgi:beta-galactosidase